MKKYSKILKQYYEVSGSGIKFDDGVMYKGKELKKIKELKDKNVLEKIHIIKKMFKGEVI